MEPSGDVILVDFTRVVRGQQQVLSAGAAAGARGTLHSRMSRVISEWIQTSIIRQLSESNIITGTDFYHHMTVV